MEPRERSAFVSAYTKVLTVAWSDEDYVNRLEANPRTALAEQGLELPADATVRIVRDIGGDPDLEAQVDLWGAGKVTGVYELRVPTSPQIEDRELSEADLEAVAGGDSYCCCCSPCCTCT
ncbi:hypothetical protein OG896_22260 [Streptomyces sp. NBC_00669]|uniref:hypothetical protein n=1 Tax=unclassified Streptomyces TaxID=2593676 RepID=UPI002E373F94|nr:hypothetical protein [Streptomyces sp. NBC_00669]